MATMKLSNEAVIGAAEVRSMKLVVELEGMSSKHEPIRQRMHRLKILTLKQLRCMAENNEDDFMMITREEAEQIGV